MFEVDENGDLIYNGESDPVSDDGDLFNIPEDVVSDEEPLPEENIEINEFPLTGSGNSFTLPVSGLSVSGEDINLTTSGDIYIYPDLPDDEPLMEDRSVYTANVTGLPNTTTLAYLEEAAKGYPYWYDYMCFKTDANYSQSMCLWIGPKAEKNPAQNRIDFSDGVDCIQVNYIRNGSTSNYYYQYSKVHYETYQIPYNSDVFLYTNIIDGYAQFDIKKDFPVSGYLLLGIIIGIIFLIFRGGGK